MPEGLDLTSSNRLEVLCDRLAELLREPAGDPLAPEIVLVQNRGMERWLRLELARPERLGICANVRFPFPNKFLTETVEAIFPGRFDVEPFERDVLAWRIQSLLPRLAADPEFSAASAYLGRGEPGDDVRTYGLAWAVADRLDQYVLYRPDMVLEWEAAAGGDWQARLWRAVCGDVASTPRGAMPEGREPIHRASLRRLLLREMGAREGIATSLPFSRVCVFGVSVLPPFHLSVLAALARHIDVHLFLMNPSREYWSLVMSDRGQARYLGREAARRRATSTPSAADLALEKGNTLLASLGTLGRAFFDDVIQCEPDENAEFVDPGLDSMLHVIQSDILSMRDPTERLPIRDDDSSLVFNSCHSEIREAEVLHDFLLELFRRRPKLSPGDVLIMSPDVETYAPLLQAVFESAQPEDARIPLSVSDRKLLAQSSLATTALRVLDLPASRCAASEIPGLLADARVRACFGLGAADADNITDWVREAGIRWGLDEAHRAELGLPAERQNTWEAGLDRLLLGCAMSGDGELCHGILPTDGPEGSEAAALGGLADLLSAIREARVLLAARREARAWPEVAREALCLLLGEDLGGEEESEELDEVLRAVGEDVRAGTNAGAPTEVGGGAFRAALARRLGDQKAAGRFLTGRLTVCSLEPMRSIPAEVICLVGMSDGAFPPPDRPQGFDLLAHGLKREGRSPVEEGRYLFLETILSARSALYVSYVGQSIRDNSPIAPAVPVSLLLDYAEKAFTYAPEPKRPARTRLVVSHPLQPWSPRYFQKASSGSPELYTYSARNASAARALARPAGDKAVRRFCPTILGPPAQRAEAVGLEDLVRFLRNPARTFVERRLGFVLREADAGLEDREPFVLVGLERHSVGQDVLDALLHDRGTGGMAAAAVLRAEGRLPHGALGAMALEDVAADVRKLWLAIAERRAGEPRLGVTARVTVEGMAIQATLPSVYSGCVVDYRWGKLRTVDRLRSWLTGLVVAASGALGEPTSAVFVASDRTVETAPAPDAAERLAEIVRLYRDGLRRPLPFFPETSRAYVDGAASGDMETALRKAQSVWEGSPWGPAPESADPYMCLCFGDEDPLGTEFQGLSLAVLGPCLAAQRASGGKA